MVKRSSRIIFPYQDVIDVLREIGPKYLKPEYRAGWSEDNPTYGYCYQMSEIYHHYHLPSSKPHVINLKLLHLGEGTHWFLKDHGVVIDPTASQFDFDVPYELGRGNGFLTKTISKRSRDLYMEILSIRGNLSW